MKIPSYQTIKRESGLPNDASFLGWALCRTDTDEFVAAAHGNRDASVTAYSGAPTLAQLHSTAKKALAVAKVIERPMALAAVFETAEVVAVVQTPI